MGSVASLSGEDIVDVWGRFPALFVIVFLAALWLLAKEVFRNDGPAVATLLAFFFSSDVGGWFRGGPNPNHVVFVVIAVSLAVSARVVRRFSWPFVGCLLAFGMSAA